MSVSERRLEAREFVQLLLGQPRVRDRLAPDADVGPRRNPVPVVVAEALAPVVPRFLKEA